MPQADSHPHAPRSPSADSDGDQSCATSAPPGSSPYVTVVVPSRNEEHSLTACLESIRNQTLSDFEVLVVDGGSTDASRSIVRDFERRDVRFRLLDNPKRIVPAALNVALGQARGTWFVRVDAHCKIPDDYVERLVSILETGAGGAGGRKLGRGRTPTGRAIATAMSSRAGVGGSAYHHDGAVRSVDHVPFGAYPIELATKIGGWNERLSVNQDFEFDIRIRKAGHEIILDPSIVIDWESRQTIGSLFRQYRRYGRGKTRVIRLHPESTRIRHLVAPVFVATSVVLLLPIRASWIRRSRVALAAMYAAFLAAAAWSDGRELNRSERSLVAISLSTMHLGWGIGFWQGLIDHLIGWDDLPIVDADRLAPSTIGDAS